MHESVDGFIIMTADKIGGECYGALVKSFRYEGEQEEYILVHEANGHEWFSAGANHLI